MDVKAKAFKEYSAHLTNKKLETILRPKRDNNWKNQDSHGEQNKWLTKC
jgi:hypothetical protein